MELGSLVQATTTIGERDFQADGEMWIHAHRGGVGHVLEIEPDGWALIFWERTETICLCEPSVFKVLGGPETGRWSEVIG